MQFHQDLYEAIPAQVREAGTEAAMLVNTTRNGFRDDAEQVRQDLAADFRKFLDGARPILTTAAQKGVNDSIANLDTAKLIASVSRQVADAVAMQKARKLLGLGLTLAGIAVLATLIGGTLLGRYAIPRGDPYAERSALYMRQLDCKTEGWKIRQGEIVCKNQENGTAVTLRIPNGN